MPLPPALAQRLAKRGLLKDASVQGFDPVQGRAVEQAFTKGGRAFNKGGSGNMKEAGGKSSYGYEGRNLGQGEEEVFLQPGTPCKRYQTHQHALIASKFTHFLWVGLCMKFS